MFGGKGRSIPIQSGTVRCFTKVGSWVKIIFMEEHASLFRLIVNGEVKKCFIKLGTRILLFLILKERTAFPGNDCRWFARGATTFRRMTVGRVVRCRTKLCRITSSIMTLSSRKLYWITICVMIPSRLTLARITFRRMALDRMTFDSITLGWMTNSYENATHKMPLSKMTHCRMTPSIMTLRRMTHSRMTLWRTMLSRLEFCVLLLCRMSFSQMLWWR